MNLTAEQLAPLETRIAFHRELAALHRREVSHHETKVAQLEQMHADLGNGQLTPPVVNFHADGSKPDTGEQNSAVASLATHRLSCAVCNNGSANYCPELSRLQSRYTEAAR